ncbi:MAG: DUF2158 domain-containing protein [Bacteroidota bacterium]
MSENEFNIEDVVQLKGGGFPMTVINFSPKKLKRTGKSWEIECAYQKQDGTPVSAIYPQNALIKSDEDPSVKELKEARALKQKVQKKQLEMQLNQLEVESSKILRPRKKGGSRMLN